MLTSAAHSLQIQTVLLLCWLPVAGLWCWGSIAPPQWVLAVISKLQGGLKGPRTLSLQRFAETEGLAGGHEGGTESMLTAFLFGVGQEWTCA